MSKSLFILPLLGVSSLSVTSDVPTALRELSVFTIFAIFKVSLSWL